MYERTHINHQLHQNTTKNTPDESIIFVLHLPEILGTCLNQKKDNCHLESIKKES
jgi:hypothetical protein